jgi:hypothetical protein
LICETGSGRTVLGAYRSRHVSIRPDVGDRVARRQARPTLLCLVQWVLSRARRLQANQSGATRSRGQTLIRPCVERSKQVGPSGEPADRTNASPVGRQVFAEPGPPLGDLARKMLEHLAGDVALQDPDHLALGAAFLGATFHVLAGTWVRGDARHDDAPQGLVGVAVTAAV